MVKASVLMQIDLMRCLKQRAAAHAVWQTSSVAQHKAVQIVDIIHCLNCYTVFSAVETVVLHFFDIRD